MAQATFAPIKIGFLGAALDGEGGAYHKIHQMAFDEAFETGVLNRRVEIVNHPENGLPRGSARNAIDGFRWLVDQGCIAVAGARYINRTVEFGGRLPERPRHQALLARLALERLAEVGVRDRDERLRPLRDRLALQVDEAELGHDVHDVGTRRRHDVAGRQRGHDAAAPHAASLVGRRETCEGLAAPGCIRAAHELKLTSGARQVPVPVGF